MCVCVCVCVCVGSVQLARLDPVQLQVQRACARVVYAQPYKIVHNRLSPRFFQLFTWKRLESSEEATVFRRAYSNALLVSADSASLGRRPIERTLT